MGVMHRKKGGRLEGIEEISPELTGVALARFMKPGPRRMLNLTMRPTLPANSVLCQRKISSNT